MSNKIVTQYIGSNESEPVVYGEGLSIEEARSKARNALQEFTSRFACEFQITATPNRITAIREIEGGSVWGYQISVISEPEIAVSLEELDSAFDILGKVLEIEHVNPDEDRFRLSDIRTDILRILRGEIRVSGNEVVFG